MGLGDPEERFPWLHVVEDIANREGFLHWELEFAHVFNDAGGFEIQVGNPPWFPPRWKEDAVLAEFQPWFETEEEPSESDRVLRRTELLSQPLVRRYFLDQLTKNGAVVAFLGSSQIYPLVTGTKPDLYRAFMCQVWTHTTTSGVIGMLHPSTHLTGNSEARLRESSYQRLRVHADFVNAGQRFFPEPVGHSRHFSVNVYGAPQEVSFDHFSWLVSVEALRLSNGHDGSGELPGVRYQNAEFDERPHRSRIVHVTPATLQVWQRLRNDIDRPYGEARLLFPVSTGEADAIAALADFPVRLGDFSPPISDGFNEGDAKKVLLIDYKREIADSPPDGSPKQVGWDDVILKGIQLGPATPIFKRHDANTNDAYGLDLVEIPDNFVPDTQYEVIDGNRAKFDTAVNQDCWVDYRLLSTMRDDGVTVSNLRDEIALDSGVSEIEASQVIEARLTEAAIRPYTSFYRLAWRNQVASDTERALYAALIPPGPTHVDGIRTTALSTLRQTALLAGFWTSIPLDYFLRATGRRHLHVNDAIVMPAPDRIHPLASGLLLRTLRLNCLTTAYVDIWTELYDEAWSGECWAFEWLGMPALQEVAPTWTRNTPLRTERARRSALVEIDALVSVWLGMDADALIGAYRGRFPVLQKFEAATWFDAHGWKISSDSRTKGQRQSEDSWMKFENYLESQSHQDAPTGYTAPFYKADRETEMRAAHAVFQKRLDDAVVRGEWDPEKREVPAR
ncbi:hypothetical protein [Pseudofrankia sp. DC12]|uniref:hypothetical protein n=1 Tax=Pseudofrankia sp. DC12 TaxID=683315 RepID=UPI0012FCFCA6|nr:hypothetical protein [Pseudofrankia sp. DC12]